MNDEAERKTKINAGVASRQQDVATRRIEDIFKRPP